tara:strand:+ start:1499 stop:1654 length:156 start_codon:yes stop_codon:yes gene_type:complete
MVLFYDNPRTQTSSVLYTADETAHNATGNIGFLVKDKKNGVWEKITRLSGS